MKSKRNSLRNSKLKPKRRSRHLKKNKNKKSKRRVSLRGGANNVEEKRRVKALEEIENLVKKGTRKKDQLMCDDLTQYNCNDCTKEGPRMCRHSKPECRHLGWCSASWGGYGFFTFYDMGKIKIILEKIFGKKIDEIPIDILESHKKIVTIMELCYNGGLVNDRRVQDNFNELTTLQVIKYMNENNFE